MTKPNEAPKQKYGSFKESILDIISVYKAIPLKDGVMDYQGVEFTFTLNPNEYYQFWGQKMDDRITKSTNHMKFIMRNMPNTHLDVWLDVSRTGRLHWHGTIRFSSLKELKLWYLERIPTLLKQHQVEMDTIADFEVWFDYCRKSYPILGVHLETFELLKNKIATKDAQQAQFFKPISVYFDETLEK